MPHTLPGLGHISEPKGKAPSPRGLTFWWVQTDTEQWTQISELECATRQLILGKTEEGQSEGCAAWGQIDPLREEGRAARGGPKSKTPYLLLCELSWRPRRWGSRGTQVREERKHALE